MITDRHREFARAVVKLAREHGMDNIRISYRNSVNSGADGYDDVTLSWREGRHGVRSFMNLETRASEELAE